MSLTDLIQHPWVQISGAVLGLALGALFGTLIVRRLLLAGINHLLMSTNFGRDQELRRHKVIPRLANIVPALFVLLGLHLAKDLPAALSGVIANVTQAFMVLTLALAASGTIAIVETLYLRKPANRQRPVKGYVQILRIATFAIATVLIVSALLDRSPVILLSGLGAMAAVLLLVFQDTILSFIAGIQISSNDMVRVGDWIEMPDFNTDGDVVEIALHTIKVRNWDKTISTIPIRNLVTHSFKNWRGMQQSGGRRIKRAVLIDQTTMRFLTADEISNLRQMRLLDDYLVAKTSEIAEWNNSLDPAMPHVANQRRLTNLGTFRAYLDAYIRQHPHVRGDMTQMVRQMPPTPQGLPLEIYCFTNTTAWEAYEGIQADIFDHILSIAPEFGLAVYQAPSGRDFAGLASARA